MTTSVALVTLGCARNEVDSEELAGRLAADGFRSSTTRPTPTPSWSTPAASSRQAKKDSVDTLLEAADLKDHGRTQAVVAVGCLAERYGEDLAESLPEADAVLGFDDYPDIAARLRSILAGETHQPAHPAGPPPAAADQPRSTRRRRRPGHGTDQRPGHATGQRAVAAASTAGPMAPLKLASGCDRRCSFCAIPSFRGSFVSRRPTDVLAEAALAGRAGRARAVPGQRELHVLRQGPRRPPAARDAAARAGRGRRHRPGPGVLPAARRDPAGAGRGDRRARPASRRTSTSPSSTPAATVLRRMRRFGDAESFLGCSTRSAPWRPQAGVRSNVIVGFPGETEADLETLCDFLVAARLDVDRRLRLLRRGRHRGRGVRRQARRRRDPRPGRARQPRWSRSSPPSAPRSGSARRVEVLVESRRPTTRPSRAGPRTRVPRSTARRPARPPADAGRRRPGPRRRSSASDGRRPGRPSR